MSFYRDLVQLPKVNTATEIPILEFPDDDDLGPASADVPATEGISEPNSLSRTNFADEALAPQAAPATGPGEAAPEAAHNLEVPPIERTPRAPPIAPVVQTAPDVPLEPVDPVVSPGPAGPAVAPAPIAPVPPSVAAAPVVVPAPAAPATRDAGAVPSGANGPDSSEGALLAPDSSRVNAFMPRAQNEEPSRWNLAQTGATVPASDQDALSALPFVGMEHEPTQAEILADSLNPGLSPVQKSEAIMTLVGQKPIREIVVRLRQEEDGWKGTHGGMGFPAAVVAEVVEKLAIEPARELGVLESVLIKHVMDIYSGLYGLEDHLDNPWVSDVLINRHDEVFIEEAGVMKRVPSPFIDGADIDNFVERLIGKYHLPKATTLEPIRDWNFQYTLPDGTDVSVRTNLVLGSNTDTGEPIISMRKPISAGMFDHLDTWTQIKEDEDDAPMTPQAAEFLRACIQHRATIMIVGGTGSGKTSLLKALVNEFSPEIRILSIEENQELILKRPNARGLLAQGNVDLSILVQSAMRMRPDIILIGECRKPAEATQYLNAANTGHDGSITTTHASGTEAGLYRILNLINEDSTKASLEYVGGQVMTGVDVVVFITAQTKVQENGEIKRLRRIMEIATLDSFSAKDNQPKFGVKPVFGRFTSEMVGIARQTNIEAPLRCEGYKGLAAHFIDKMEKFGLSEAQLRKLLDTSTNKHTITPGSASAPKTEVGRL